MVRVYSCRINQPAPYRMNPPLDTSSEKHKVITAVAITLGTGCVITGVVLNTPILIGVGAASSLVSLITYCVYQSRPATQGPFLHLQEPV